MGGVERSAGKPGSKANKESVNDWLQEVIDTLAYEYGWSKPEIFEMYPREIEILMDKARERREQESDISHYKAAIAACVPHMKDGGKEYLKGIMRKYKKYDDGSDVTKEQIDRDTEMAKRLLGM